ncbi:hypothetical protein [Desulfovibrio litoralis]|uniref:Uncharacterized protein n=1 Tax=Desulfovibrio litoralis DSM 11393 TaxID=1121455 RepID=A0A1M7SH48_9BACT|nr:hypothetical protein [Desulfovibrio litoralis]SHN57787.1 hypothetical protein SAMN02745728_00949 [Desulfovibrio litoralis DSM 11393]
MDQFIDFLTYSQNINVFSSLLTLFSLILASIKVIQKREMKKAMRANFQKHYNIYFQIARSASRIRHLEDDSSVNDIKLSQSIREANLIRGVVDTARADLIAYAREEINFTPFYEHPAVPNKKLPLTIALGKDSKLIPILAELENQPENPKCVFCGVGEKLTLLLRKFNKK